MEKLKVLSPQLAALNLQPDKIIDLQVVALDAWRRATNKWVHLPLAKLRVLCVAVAIALFSLVSTLFCLVPALTLELRLQSTLPAL